MVDYGAAAVTHGATGPESPPVIAIKNLCGASVRLVECGNDEFSRGERLISGEAPGDRSVKNGPGGGILEATGNAQALELAHVQNKFEAFGTGAVEINGDEDTRNGDFVVFETVAAGMEIGVQLKTDARGQLLRPTRVIIVLRVGAHVTDSLAGSDGGVSDEAGEQGIFDRRREGQAIVRGVNHGFCLGDVIREADARASLLVGANQIEVIVAKAYVDRKISQRSEVVL